MRHYRLAGLISVLTVALIAGACSHSAPAVNDDAIVSTIQSKLYKNPDLKTQAVDVASKGGVVTLTGTVNAPLEKLAVEDLARNTQGVKQVLDQLTVAQAATPTEPAAEPPAPVTPRAHRLAKTPFRERAANADYSSRSVHEDAQAAREAADSAPSASQTADQPAQSAPEAAAPPEPVSVMIPAGTAIIVRTIDSISSATAMPDQEYAASIFSPVAAGDKVVIPRGADARLQVAAVTRAGHFQGRSELKLALISVKVNGKSVPIQTGYYMKQGSSRGVNSAEKIGGGAGLGALIGGLIGHGKGAGIGAAIGAAGGAIDQQATHGQQVTIAPETEITFTLTSPVTVTLPPANPASAAQGAQ